MCGLDLLGILHDKQCLDNNFRRDATLSHTFDLRIKAGSGVPVSNERLSAGYPVSKNCDWALTNKIC